MMRYQGTTLQSYFKILNPNTINVKAHYRTCLDINSIYRIIKDIKTIVLEDK